MQEEDFTPLPNPRELEAIFDDLRVLCTSDGAIHNISALIYRDWLLTVDMQEGKVITDPDHRWSTSKLNNNELMLLLGLAVQADSDRIFSLLPQSGDFGQKADLLLREMHDRILANYLSHIDLAQGKIEEGPEALGAIAREAIYYGADSFFLKQFETFARHRYRNDGDWLLINAGLSIRPMLEIARFMADRTNLQMTYASALVKERDSNSLGELTNSLLI